MRRSRWVASRSRYWCSFILIWWLQSLNFWSLIRFLVIKNQNRSRSIFLTFGTLQNFFFIKYDICYIHNTMLDFWQKNTILSCLVCILHRSFPQTWETWQWPITTWIVIKKTVHMYGTIVTPLPTLNKQLCAIDGCLVLKQ